MHLLLLLCPWVGASTACLMCPAAVCVAYMQAMSVLHICQPGLQGTSQTSLPCRICGLSVLILSVLSHPQAVHRNQFVSQIPA